jgi:hypothetical protein
MTDEDKRRAASRAVEVLTLEAIERDPWNAVRLDISQDANRELLNAIGDAARERQETFHVASDVATAAAHFRSAQALADGESAAAQRILNVDRLSSLMEAHDAGRVSDLNELLGDDLVQRLTEALTHDTVPDGRIASYLKEAEGLISGDLPGGPTPEVLTLEALEPDRDQWNAVLLPLPAEPSAELVRWAHVKAEYCYEAARWRADNPDSPAVKASEPSRWPMEDGTGPKEAAELALNRLVELEAINPELTRMIPEDKAPEVLTVDQIELADPLRALAPHEVPGGQDAANLVTIAYPDPDHTPPDRGGPAPKDGTEATIYKGQGVILDKTYRYTGNDLRPTEGYVPISRQGPPVEDDIPPGRDGARAAPEPVSDRPLDARGVTAGGQGKSDSLTEHTHDRNLDHPHPPQDDNAMCYFPEASDSDGAQESGERLNASSQFRSAGAEIVTTEQGQRQSDVLAVIHQLANTAGVKDTPEFTEWKNWQAELGDKISNTSDPTERAALRVDREIGQHDYAAALGFLIGETRAGEGKEQEAADMGKLATVHQEISANLRAGQPERPGPDSPAVDTRAEFAENAAAVGREIGLGPTAKTIHVAEMPTAGATVAVDSVEGPQAALMLGVTVDRGGPGESMQLRTLVQNRPETDLLDSEQAAPHRPGDKSAVIELDAEAETPHDALLTRIGDESSKRQEAEDAALRGGGDDRQAAYAKALASLTERVSVAKETYGEKAAPENEQGNEQGQEASHAAAFRSFGR